MNSSSVLICTITYVTMAYNAYVNKIIHKSVKL